MHFRLNFWNIWLDFKDAYEYLSSVGIEQDMLDWEFQSWTVS